MRLVADLLAAIADAHSPRALVRAIAATLSRELPIVRLELGAPVIAIAELANNEWRCVDSADARSTQQLAPGLSVVIRGEMPAFCSVPAFRSALTQVLHAAARHLEVVQRVATLSRRAHGENRELRADLERLESPGEIVARSPEMRAVLSRAALVARHATTVLITGESGTGKEVLAREIHRRSPRAHRPMLHVNCGAIPEALVESELFGHERGAFTGADRSHAGLFERAHRSTLLLDEVGELPPSAQAKLLRVLQERKIRRIGGEHELDVDVRLIAATNRSLAAMVEAGTFREDLFYRLDVFSIGLPPLRQRRGDVAALVASLTAELARRLRVEQPLVTRADLKRLEAHDWPGNVRELQNVLETAMILGGGDGLELPDDFPRRRSSGAAPAGPRFSAAIRAAIEESLRETRGKIYGADGAAARLGLKPGTLQSKMRKLGIDRALFTAR
ncbi:MAG: sigma 54-interacting transcriptional regulator [Deltaproteobacteria bacterium]|nr:sigma 54-interacting transcriptional regulator [Deltaproteobacteria bacterium]